LIVGGLGVGAVGEVMLLITVVFCLLQADDNDTRTRHTAKTFTNRVIPHPNLTSKNNFSLI